MASRGSRPNMVPTLPIKATVIAPTDRSRQEYTDRK